MAESVEWTPERIPCRCRRSRSPQERVARVVLSLGWERRGKDLPIRLESSSTSTVAVDDVSMMTVAARP